jgi:A/G-specific adenine glycosylase
MRASATVNPSPRALRSIRRGILDWYAEAKRDFPWRGTTDPWAVLVSEVMLQQTQAARVAERFPRFMMRFPTPESLSAATDADVLAAWSGLGYNRRAIALRRAAVTLAAAGWPGDTAGLETLPGVGPYTARAVGALAFGRRVGAVDTNVRRWLVRRLGLRATASARTLQHLADALAAPAADAADAAAWMHASMEFGAAVCTAQRPDCRHCAVARGCPSRGNAAPVPVPRQPTFAGSARERRGRVLRLLAEAPGHRLDVAAVAAASGDADLHAVLAALARDGLAYRRGEVLFLGAPDREDAVATIGT